MLELWFCVYIFIQRQLYPLNPKVPMTQHNTPLVWEQKLPTESGWYWCTPDLDQEPFGIYGFEKDVFGIINTVFAQFPNAYFAGPIPEPMNPTVIENE